MEPVNPANPTRFGLLFLSEDSLAIKIENVSVSVSKYSELPRFAVNGHERKALQNRTS